MPGRNLYWIYDRMIRISFSKIHTCLSKCGKRRCECWHVGMWDTLETSATYMTVPPFITVIESKQIVDCCPQSSLHFITIKFIFVFSRQWQVTTIFIASNVIIAAAISEMKNIQLTQKIGYFIHGCTERMQKIDVTISFFIFLNARSGNLRVLLLYKIDPSWSSVSFM